jgi:hypothetical protein
VEEDVLEPGTLVWARAVHVLAFCAARWMSGSPVLRLEYPTTSLHSAQAPVHARPFGSLLTDLRCCIPTTRSKACAIDKFLMVHAMGQKRERKGGPKKF